MSLIALGEQVLNGLVLSVFYALAALGLAIIFGVLKIVNFAHGELYMIGGFVYYGVASLVGLPPGSFALDIFGMVLNGITVRGSIVGTRLDLQESLEFAAQDKVAATVAADRLENINDIFARMHRGEIEGRIVLDMAA